MEGLQRDHNSSLHFLASGGSRGSSSSPASSSSGGMSAETIEQATIIAMESSFLYLMSVLGQRRNNIALSHWELASSQL